MMTALFDVEIAARGPGDETSQVFGAAEQRGEPKLMLLLLQGKGPALPDAEGNVRRCRQ